MLKSRYYLFIIFCLGLFISSKATHNRAGEITYKWLYGFTYQIKITTYTNIGSTTLADRCEDTVYFGDGTRSVVLRSNGPIGACSPAHEGVPITSNIKLNEYITTHTFPGPGNYKMSMEDPNRNAGIMNIPNSVNQLFYIESYLVIPTFGSGKNDSPILTFPPIDNACLGQCFYHNPGAYDIDGDSLSYQLTNCRGHLGAICPGYSYPATGNGTYGIDSLNGTLTWCTPQLQGEYNLAMIIKEWRKDDNGTSFLVGYVLRDLQVDVGACFNNNPQIIINNSDTCIVAGTTVTNTVLANDPDNDILTMQANGGPFAVASPIATFSSPQGSAPVAGLFTWNTTNTHVKRLPYQITIKAMDNDPYVSLVHFKTFNVKILPNAPRYLTSMTVNNSAILLNWNKPTNYLLIGTNRFLRYRVYRKTGASNWVHSNKETAPPAYTGFVYIGSSSNNIADTLFYDHNSGNPFIDSLTYSYVVLSEYTDGATSYVSNIAMDQFFVGINELSLKTSDIKISPNPITDSFTITFNQNYNEVFTIDLFDVSGRKIKTFTNNESLAKQNTIQLSLENINRGIYFLKITGNHTTNITKKIIKQ